MVSMFLCSAQQLRLPCFLSNSLTGMASDPLQWAEAELVEIAVVEVPEIVAETSWIWFKSLLSRYTNLDGVFYT